MRREDRRKLLMQRVLGALTRLPQGIFEAEAIASFKKKINI